MDQHDFQEHLRNEHRLSFTSTYIKELVYGGTDGIVTTFAVVSGFSGASLFESHLNLSYLAVLLFGFANLFADGAAMGLGNILSLRSEKKLYQMTYQKELAETTASFDFEYDETIHLFEKKGFTHEDATQLTDIVVKNPDFWVSFMVQEECGLTNSEDEKAWLNGLVTFGSFVFFGAIPLIPYLFFTSNTVTFSWSIVSSCLALIGLGLCRSIISKENWVFAVLDVWVVGALAACLGYGVGLLFSFFI